MQIVSSKMSRVIVGLLVFATGILSIIGSGGGPVQVSPASFEIRQAQQRQNCQLNLNASDIGSRPKNYRPLIISYMRERLKDPDSAQYAWDKADGPNKGYGSYISPSNCYVGWAVCVSVNAKNSYGGYTGSERWIFIIRNNVVTFGIKYSPEENTSGCS